jgi:hypothetical protein
MLQSVGRRGLQKKDFKGLAHHLWTERVSKMATANLSNRVVFAIS